MRVPFRFAAVFVVLTLLPAPAFAWGFVGHRLIMGRAIDLLPPELKPFFVKHRDEIVVRVVDPDTWRVAGWPENAQSLPRFRRAGIRQASVHRAAARLRRGAREVRPRHARAQRPPAVAPRGDVRPAAPRVRGLRPPVGLTRRPTSSCFPPSTSHYIQDAHQPFHATDNYDGQLTGQRGIHARFETRSVRAVSVAADTQPARAEADHEPARRRVRRPARQLSARRRHPPGRQGGRRRQGNLRRRLLRDVLRGGEADARAAAVGIDHRDRLADHRRVGSRRGGPTVKLEDRVRSKKSPGSDDSMVVFLVPAGRRSVRALFGSPRGARHASRTGGRPVPPVGAFGVGPVARSSSTRRGVGRPRGRFADWRDAVVCRLAETIAEQRTLWALRDPHRGHAQLPGDDRGRARAGRRSTRALSHARRHHRRWLIVDLILFVVARCVFFFVPGPNLVAYYFAFRVDRPSAVVARRAAGARRIAWTFEPDAGPGRARVARRRAARGTRAPRVAAIAARLNLPRLPRSSIASPSLPASESCRLQISDFRFKIGAVLKLRELADRLNCRLEGDGEIEIHRVAGIEQARPGDLTFVANPKYLSQLATTRASAVIVTEQVASGQSSGAGHSAAHRPSVPGVRARRRRCSRDGAGAAAGHRSRRARSRRRDARRRRVDRPVRDDRRRRVGRRADRHLSQRRRSARARASATTASIHSQVSIRDRVVDRQSRHRCRTARSSAATASASRRQTDGTHLKIPQHADVVIEDDVEIGANTTIDRPAVGETRIGAGTKIDNLVQIAHGVSVGRRVLFAAQVGIAGSTVIEDDVVLAGQVGVAGHVRIGKGVDRDGADRHSQLGRRRASSSRAIRRFDHRDWLKSSAVFRQLPALKKRVAELEQRIAELEEKLADMPDAVRIADAARGVAAACLSLCVAASGRAAQAAARRSARQRRVPVALRLPPVGRRRSAATTIRASRGTRTAAATSISSTTSTAALHVSRRLPGGARQRVPAVRSESGQLHARGVGVGARQRRPSSPASSTTSRAISSDRPKRMRDRLERARRACPAAASPSAARRSTCGPRSAGRRAGVRRLHLDRRARRRWRAVRSAARSACYGRGFGEAVRRRSRRSPAAAQQRGGRVEAGVRLHGHGRRRSSCSPATNG